MKSISKIARRALSALLVTVFTFPFALSTANDAQATVNVQSAPRANHFFSVTTGNSHACAISEIKRVRCWGDNSEGQINVPPDLGTVSQISAGIYQTCAVKTNKLAKCWGSNQHGQSTIPSDLGEVSQIANGSGFACALKLTGAIQCWGANHYGTLNVPTDVGPSQQIAASLGTVCVLERLGGVKCWGNGDVTPPQNVIPADLGTVKQISVGVDHACVVKINGYAQCWGGNEFQQSTIPSDLGQVKQISAGLFRTCVVNANSDARCWGAPMYQLPSVPTNLDSVSQISANYDPVCAIQINGEIKCWGSYDGVESSSELYVPSYSAPSAPSGLRLDPSDDGSMMYVHASPPLESHGPVVYVVKNAKTKQLVCRTATLTNDNCFIAGTTLGKTYQVSVVVQNDIGDSPSKLSKSTYSCANIEPTISTELSNVTPSSGTSIKVSGVLSHFCPAPPSTMLVRSRKVGKTWGSWKTISISRGRYSITKTFLTPSEVQTKAVTRTGVSITSSATVNVKPGSFGYKLTTRRIYTPQGFAQGGKLTYSISTGRGYNGTCGILADTDYAYNFALTLMGEEHKMGTFKVTNGKGSGSLTMRWNGEVSASISCSSPDFPDDDFISIKNVLLRANF